MITIGVAFAFLATHFLGGSNRPRLNDDARAAAIFHQDFPETAIKLIIYSNDRRTAFLSLAQNRVGIVQGMGNKFLTRQIIPSEILLAEAIGATELKLGLSDFTLPRTKFSFANETSRNAVRNWLTGGRLQ
jgi:hypothetical protein